MKYLILILLSLTACNNRIPGWTVNKCVSKCGVGKVDRIVSYVTDGTIWTCTCSDSKQYKITTQTVIK